MPKEERWNSWLVRLNLVYRCLYYEWFISVYYETPQTLINNFIMGPLSSFAIVKRWGRQ